MLMEEVMPEVIGIGIARKLMGDIEELNSAEVSIENGIAGDARGKKRNRQITILFEDDWEEACKEINQRLHWTNRRANLFVNGLSGPQKEGSIIQIGNIKLKVSFETDPCDVMEKTQKGLEKALELGWRGGVCCSVITGGTLSIGDKVTIN